MAERRRVAREAEAAERVRILEEGRQKIADFVRAPTERSIVIERRGGGRLALLLLTALASLGGCGTATASGTRSQPTAYVASATGYVFTDGVRSDVPCAEETDGHTDYTLCCAAGFLPVGNAPDGGVVCLEER